MAERDYFEELSKITGKPREELFREWKEWDKRMGILDLVESVKLWALKVYRIKL